MTDKTKPAILSEEREARMKTPEGGRIPPRLAAIAAEAMRRGFAARPDDDGPEAA